MLETRLAKVAVDRVAAVVLFQLAQTRKRGKKSNVGRGKRQVHENHPGDAVVHLIFKRVAIRGDEHFFLKRHPQHIFFFPPLFLIF